LQQQQQQTPAVMGDFFACVARCLRIIMHATNHLSLSTY
jgi:hypothetical protein